MIGVRIEPAIGARSGLAIGVGRDEIEIVPFPIDATSRKGVPVTQADWDAVFDYAGVTRKTVSHTHPHQDASGASAAATVGTAETITGTIEYQQAQAGWTRTASQITETAAERIAFASGVGPDPTLLSSILFGYIDLTAVPAATRDFGSVSLNAANCKASILTTSLIRITVLAAVATGVVDHVALGVFPFMIQLNRAVSRAACYTEAEKVTGAWGTGLVLDGVKGWGTTGTSPAMRVLWDSWFGGAQAEWTETEIKAVMTALGWSPAWTPA